MKTNNFFKTLDLEYQISEINRFNTINMDLNENLFGCASEVLEVIREANPNLINLYPQTQEFEYQYARYLGLKAEQVIATNGADSAIEIIMKSLRPGTKIIIPYPTFSMYEIIAKWYNLKVEKVAYNQELEFPGEQIWNKMNSGTSALFLANPDSPTGGFLDKNYIENLIRKVNSQLVVIDETYYHFVGQSMVEFVNSHDNVIFLHSFSKAYGLAGLRLGVLIASKNITSIVRKWLKPFEVNQFALLAGIKALRHPEYVQEIVNKVAIGKKMLCQSIREMGFNARESNANFILIHAGIWAHEIVRKLKKAGILVKLLHFPGIMEDTLRVVVGPEEINQKFLFALESALKDIWRSEKNHFARH